MKLRTGLVLLVCMTLTGCFDEPIREHLHLHVTPGAMVVVWTHDIDAPDRGRDNPAVRRRMEESRDAVERGVVPAARWFERVDAAASRFTIERTDGVVRRARWSAVLDDATKTENLLADMGWSAVIDRRAAGVDLYMEPAASPRATRAERQLADEQLETWSVAVAGYLDATIALYDHLDRRPDRAVACFAHVFEDDDVNRAWPLDDGEQELIEALGAAVDSVGEVLLVPDGEPYSPNGLSRLVFDPFPARLTVSAAGPPVTVEGVVNEGSHLERRPISLWQALADLEGLWVEPDVVTALATPAPLDAQPEVDPAEFAARPRRYGGAPSPAEVEGALRAALDRDDQIVIRWRMPVTEETTGGDPQRLLAAAEASVPPR